MASRFSVTSVVFQPVVALCGPRFSVYALEALPYDVSSFADPFAYLRWVRQTGGELEWDRAALEGVVRSLAALHPDHAVAINLHTVSLQSDPQLTRRLLDGLRERAWPSSQVIVELSDCPTDTGVGWLRRAIHDLRSAGVRIAFDGCGSTPVNFQRLLECRPDLIKVDRYLLADCDRDVSRQGVLDALATMARDLDVSLVAAGVATHGELATVRRFGIELVQGELIATPMTVTELQRSGLLEDRVIDLPRAQVSCQATVRGIAKGVGR